MILRSLGFALGLVFCTTLSAAPMPLKVAGTQLVDGSGQAVRLRGVNCAGMEWSSDGEGHIAKTIEVAVTEWHANLIRLPLSQDRWFGHGPEQKDGGESYRALVRQLVDFCSAHDAYVILDLHWSDAGVWGRNIGQHNLPDKNSVVFWRDVARTYANHSAVLFDLYNEPARIDWDQWFKGGTITEADEKTKAKLIYEAVGLPGLVGVIRATGAKNVILAGGLNWAYEVDGITAARRIRDPDGNGVVYAVHPYPHKYGHIGWETLEEWTSRMEAFAEKFPLIVTEFGALSREWPTPKEWNSTDEKWNRGMLAVLESHQWNWTAWDFHPHAAPCLIKDWDYTPTREFGVWVKQALAESATRP
jgi:hypothetical protein